MLKLAFLTGLTLVAASLIGLRMDRVQAQQPCVPISALSTVCAPVTYPVIICVDQLAPYAYPTQFYPGYYNGMSAAFYGQTYFWNGPNPYNFYNSYPNRQLELTVQPGTTYGGNTIVGVKVLQSLCTPPVAPTAVPAPPIATPVVITRVIVEAPVKAGIVPPKTGDAGLLP